MRFRTKILLCMVWILALALGIGGTMLIQISFQDSLGREQENLLQSYRITTSVLETAMETARDSTMEIVAADTFSQMQEAMDWTYVELNLNGTELYRRGTLLAPEPKNLDAGVCQITIFEVQNTGHYIQLCAGITVDDSRMIVTLVRSISEIKPEMRCCPPSGVCF